MKKLPVLGMLAAAAVLLILPLAAASELVYDDFNDGTLGTNTGGAAGCMSYDGNHDPQVRFVQGYEGNALELSYNFPEGGWCGYWSFLHSDGSGQDLSGYTDLQMWVKGASGGEVFKVELKDSGGNYRAIYATLVRGFESGAPATWTKLTIPLYNFAGVVDLTSIKQVNIVFDRPPRQGTVLLDRIAFTTDSPARALPAGLVVDDFNDGSGPNNLGGSCGTMDPNPTSNSEWIIENYAGETEAYEGLGCLKLTYNRGISSWVGYWGFLNKDQQGVNVSSYNYLSMYVKGANGGESFRVELKDGAGHTSKQTLSGITTSWQEFKLDLSSFSGVDLRNLTQVNFVMDLSPNSGTVYIDLLRFISEGAPPQPPSENTVVEILPENQEVMEGESFSVRIEVTPATGVAGVQCTLRFNPELLGVLGAAEGGFLAQGGGSSFFQIISMDNQLGKIDMVGVRLGGLAGSPGVFATVRLRAKNAQGTSQLWLENVIVGGENAQVLPVSIRGASVTVGAYAPWDVNRDRQVNLQDILSVISKWGQTGSPGWINEDINRDGIVNVLDLILIGQHWTG